MRFAVQERVAMGWSPYQHDEQCLGHGSYRRSPTVLSSPEEELTDDTVGNERFLGRLRSLLLRVRVAGQLRQDVVVEKHFVELKALCRGVCNELGTTEDAFQRLWAVVGRQRGAVANTNGRLVLLTKQHHH